MRARTPIQVVFCLASTLILQTQFAWPQPSAGYKYSPPKKLSDGIQIGTLASAKLEEKTIVAGTNKILSGVYANIHSLLLFRDSKLVYENYFGGEDENNREGEIGFVSHNRDTLHDIRSITKSVVALAVLIARSQGKIKTLDQPVFDLFPEYRKHAEGDKKQITIRHLLTMTPGLEWNEEIPPLDPKNTHFQMNSSADPIEYVLSRRAMKKPGTAFEYNSGTTQLLAVIVKKTTGLNVEQFIKTHLLGPLGIKKYEFSKWTGGEPDADSGLRLRSRDLAKIGLLIANKGMWNGKRVIPEKLVTEAVAEHIRIPAASVDTSGDLAGYGYQIWRFSYTEGQGRINLIELSGNGGQKVYIDAANRLVIIITAGNYDRCDLKKYSMDIYFDLVFPALLDPIPKPK